MPVRLDSAARYLAELSDWSVSNLELQKLLYLAQVDYADRNDGEMLVREQFQAWDYGPVIPELYRKLKMFGASAVRDVFRDARPIRVGTPSSASLRRTWQDFGSVPPGELIEVTHWDRGGWAARYEPGIRNINITQSDVVREARNHYVPRFATTTGDIDVHEIGVMDDGRIVFVNTAYSCLATLSATHSFRPYWIPPFISKLAPEDRCHLNGMAMRDGKPAFVTSVSRSDIVNGWRERRGEGGTITDVASGEAVTTNLSMPHSPRWVDGQLYVLNSGRGEIGRIDLPTGRFEPIAFCPGFLRGFQIHNGHAIVGLSKPRDGSFKGLALDDLLKKKDAEPWCGIQIVNLATGDIVQWLRMEGEVAELFDVCVLPGVRQPMSTGIVSDEIHRMVTIDREGAPAPTAD